MENIHALIIDDDADNVEVLSELLQDENVTCTATQDPRNLETALAQMERVDVIFLDLEMPGIDGYEMLQILKNDLDVSAPVVAYTVHLSEAVAARRMGFDSFLGKPLDGSRFSDQLRRILDGETVWEPR
jgi:two-component system cell cycle response regulator DivK